MKGMRIKMCISDLSGCNLIGFASSLALLVSQEVETEDLAILAAFFTAFADNLALYAAGKIIPNISDNSET